MTSDELECTQSSRIETAYFSYGGYWLGMLKMEGMLYELEFDPMLHWLAYGTFSNELFKTNRIVSIIGLESADMRVKVLRAATCPLSAILNTIRQRRLLKLPGSI
jgi:hypothetical protein